MLKYRRSRMQNRENEENEENETQKKNPTFSIEWRSLKKQEKEKDERRKDEEFQDQKQQSTQKIMKALEFEEINHTLNSKKKQQTTAQPC